MLREGLTKMVKIKRGDCIYEFEKEYLDLIEGSRRTLYRVDKFGKRDGQSIKEIYHEGRWVDLSEYLKDKELPDSSSGIKITNKTSLATLATLKNFFTLMIDKKSKQKFREEKVENIKQASKFNKGFEELKRMSGSKFQDYCIRWQIYNNALDLNNKEKIAGKELKLKISEYIREYGEYNLPEENKRRTSSKKPLLTEGGFVSILKAGIEAAYIYADKFLKLKAENIDLCTNDSLDHKKIDYIQVETGKDGLIDTVYFIQIKSNLEDAESGAEEIYKAQQEYLDSLKIVNEEEFKRMKEEEATRVLKEMNSEEKERKVINQDICFARRSVSRTIYIDIRNETQKVVKEEDLTLPYK